MHVAKGLVVAICIFLTGGLVTALFRRIKQHSCLPDGPPGDNWIAGNARDFYSNGRWEKFSEWSKIYGDIIYLSVFGRPIVICNKFEDARELMDRRGSIYSDRMRNVWNTEVLKVRSATHMPYGDTWRAYRRLTQQYLNPRAVTAFRPIQSQCVLNLLDDLLLHPGSFWKHLERFVQSTILSTTYGYVPARENDPLVQLYEKREGVSVRFGPFGSTFVDFFPILRYIEYLVPGTEFWKVAQEGRKTLQEMRDIPYSMVKEQRASCTAGPSLLSRMLDDAERQGIEKEAHLDAIKNVCAAMYRAGVSTTLGVIHAFILAMVLHPHVAKKAQKELDNVLDGVRLPSIEDQDSLPYIYCILKECLRWAPPFPLGIAHRAMEEDELYGRRIPRGSMIIPNIWFMMRDERNYTEPESFNPDRFMKSNEVASAILDPLAAVFGFGRRICPGRHFAEASIWMAIASILAVFDVLPITDDNGTECPPKIEFKGTVNDLRLKEFACRFVPRSEKEVALVRNFEQR